LVLQIGDLFLRREQLPRVTVAPMDILVPVPAPGPFAVQFRILAVSHHVGLEEFDPRQQLDAALACTRLLRGQRLDVDSFLLARGHVCQ
jgi:hypothetical protein